MVASVAGPVLVEAGVEHPVQGVLDAPVSAHGRSEACRAERGRGEIIAPNRVGARAKSAKSTQLSAPQIEPTSAIVNTSRRSCRVACPSVYPATPQSSHRAVPSTRVRQHQPMVRRPVLSSRSRLHWCASHVWWPSRQASLRHWTHQRLTGAALPASRFHPANDLASRTHSRRPPPLDKPPR